MDKTLGMRLLEAERGRQIETLVLEALEKHKGTSQCVNRVAVDLNISHETLREWCRRFKIELHDYARDGRKKS